MDIFRTKGLLKTDTFFSINQNTVGTLQLL